MDAELDAVASGASVFKAVRGEYGSGKFPPQVFAGVLTATLTVSSTGQPIPGQTITITTGGTVLGTAVTNSNGVATLPATLLLPLITLNGGYTATYTANTNYQPSTTHAGLIG